jgi:hypothetical protein
VAALAAVTLLGAALRLLWLDRIPGGLFFDVAANLFDVLDVLDGARPIWFPRNNGREPLMLYLQAATALVWGPTPLAAKAAAASLGVVTVPATYLLGREAAASLGDGAARRIGLVAAFLVATMYWHLHFSRLGLRTIALPLFLALGMGLLLRALRSRSPTIALGAGVATGLAMYTYTASRLLPLALVPTLAVALLSWRGRRSALVVGLFLAAWLIVTVPLGLYYVEHRAEVEGRAAAVSVLNPEIGGGDPAGAAARGLISTAEATVWRGAESALENLPGRPLFEPLTGAMLLLGAGLALLALARGPAGARVSATLLLATAAAMALSPALSVNPPGFVRISGMVPPLVALAALGYGWAWARLSWRPLAGAALAVPLLWTSYDYFVLWAPSDVAFRATMEDKLEGAALVSRWVERGERVFLAPLYARDFTYRYLLRDVPFDSFDLGAALVVPGDGRPARYAFPPEDRDGLARVAARLGARPEFEVASDHSGQRPLLATLLLSSPSPAVAAPARPFEDGIALVGARLSQPAARPGEKVELALEWLAVSRPGRDYSVFVHVRDAAGQTRFQRDRMPGDGSVPTSRWRVDDRVGDYYALELPPDLPAGEYLLVAGLYDLATGQRLALVDQPTATNEVEVARLKVAG